MLWPCRWPRSIISSLVLSNPWGDPWDVGNPALRLALSDAFEYIPLKGKTLQFALDTFQSFMQSHTVWFFKDGVPRIPVGFGPIHTSLYNFKGCRDFSGFNLSMPCFTEAVHMFIVRTGFSKRSSLFSLLVSVFTHLESDGIQAMMPYHFFLASCH